MVQTREYAYGEDLISLDLWSSAARRENNLCAIHLIIAFAAISVTPVLLQDQGLI